MHHDQEISAVEWPSSHDLEEVDDSSLKQGDNESQYSLIRSVKF